MTVDISRGVTVDVKSGSKKRRRGLRRRSFPVERAKKSKGRGKELTSHREYTKKFEMIEGTVDQNQGKKE